jgi:hypothetical protein
MSLDICIRLGYNYQIKVINMATTPKVSLFLFAMYVRVCVLRTQHEIHPFKFFKYIKLYC